MGQNYIVQIVLPCKVLTNNNERAMINFTKEYVVSR